MKLNEIGEVWNSANRLLSDFIGLLSSKSFATMATWRNDFSSYGWAKRASRERASKRRSNEGPPPRFGFSSRACTFDIPQMESLLADEVSCYFWQGRST